MTRTDLPAPVRTTTRGGHPILGAISGLLFGISISCALLAFGIVPLSSVILVIIPLALLILGIVWGVAAPLRRSTGP